MIKDDQQKVLMSDQLKRNEGSPKPSALQLNSFAEGAELAADPLQMDSTLLP